MNKICGFLAALTLLGAASARADTAADYAALPPLLSRSSKPMVMFALGVDHQLFNKAYSDYSDLNGDGLLDTKYDNAITYYGYFDSAWCYGYSGGMFAPSNAATNHQCSGEWSGNMLNWASMTRIDVLRRVLYGGFRSTDTSSATVLERSHVPNDSHAFAKVLVDDPLTTGVNEVSLYTPFTVTAAAMCNYSSSVGAAPWLRVADASATGALTKARRWAVSELSQCLWTSSNSPGSNSLQLGGGDLNLRVAVCVNSKDANSARCKAYPNGGKKPAGLLQKYGENEQVQFGLLSGSYQKHLSGGVLRKNIGLFSGSGNTATDEVDVTTGQFLSPTTGIIKTLNAVHITSWNNVSVHTDCNSPGISVATVLANTTPGSANFCSNWGNPLAEIHLEALRYFSGLTSATTAFAADDSGYIAGLTTPSSWSNPMTADTACSNCSIVLLSAGLNSFDTDQLDSANGIPGLTGAASVNTKTDSVGTVEYPSGFNADYLSGGGSDNLCSTKTLSSLSSARGICPELPQLLGGYQLAGLAYHGKTTDLRTASGFDGIQSVDTYAVELSESLPSFRIPVGGNDLFFQPLCQSKSGGAVTDTTGWSVCSLIDAEILSETFTYDNDGKVTAGSLLLHWEDSNWGNDYDLDGAQRIRFCVGAACAGSYYGGVVADGVVKFIDDVLYTAAGFHLRFSFNLIGAAEFTGVNSAWVLRPGDQNFNLFQNPPVNPQNAPAPVETTVTAGSSTARQLKKPMWYAAKFGGFTDTDNNGSPTIAADVNNTAEWDSLNNLTGALGADGEPDNYYFANNPGQLEAQLGSVLNDIVSRVSSGTNAAVVSNNSQGVGAVYQALYQPQLTANGKTVSWTGTVQAMFIDSNGLLREDSDEDGRLDDYATDKVVQLVYNTALKKTMVQRYNRDTNGVLTADGAAVELSALKPVWNTAGPLSALSNSTITNQRAYSTAASSGRHIKTFIDADNDGVVDTGEVIDFTASTFQAVDVRKNYLVASTDTEADELINYVRGQEGQNGARNRTIDLDGNGTNEVLRLGDVIHSTPAIVGAPKDLYDLRFGDSTYTDFRNLYAARRQMVYFGANDGLLHAVNGGFWNGTTLAFDTAQGTKTAHALGAEVWAYAPMNLLPHLRWLRQADYPHVYFVDGEPISFDAKIFSADATHPGGWGTVLAIGMRLGGSPTTVDADDNGATGTDGREQAMRSAYMLFDITNPEIEPTLIAEISAPELGLTLGKPVVIKRRVPGDANDWANATSNNWYLVFGSGPHGTNALRLGQSDQAARLFVYDLVNKQFATNAGPMAATLSSSAYVGDLAVSDWGSDLVDDVVYFGLTSDDGTTVGGGLYRWPLNFAGLTGTTPSVFVNTGEPILSAPVPSLDDQGKQWVHVGTGRLLIPSDNRTFRQELFLGVKEPMDGTGTPTNAAVLTSSLIDTTNIRTYEDGNIKQLSGSVLVPVQLPAGTTRATFDSFKQAMRAEAGWKILLTAGTSAIPSGRNLSNGVRVFSLMLFNEYVPPVNQCSIDGTSYLYAVDFISGIAPKFGALGTTNDPLYTQGELAGNRVQLGIGLASAPVIHQGESGNLTVISQSSTAAIFSPSVNYVFPPSGRQSWRELIVK